MANSAITQQVQGLATTTSPGLVGTGAQTFGGVKTFNNGLEFTSASLSDVQATILGLKQYIYQESSPGTPTSPTYNGGIRPSIIPGSQVTSVGTVTRAVFCPYQTQDGSWRMKFNIRLDGATSTAAAGHQVQITGITFKNVTNFNQSISGYTNTQWSDIVVVANTSALNVGHSSSVAPTQYGFSGDVELNGKPTWAY